MRKAPILALTALMLVGCATASRMNRISLGMTKSAVIESIGDPNSTKAGDGYEVLEYMMSANSNDAFYGRETAYWVVLQSGIVTKYGRAGDFGTAANPTNTLIIQQK